MLVVGLTSEAWFRSRAVLCEICGGSSATETGFSSNTSVLPLLVYLQQYSVLFFICVLQLPQEQTDEAREPS
jgi:hypothetical protein